MIEDQPNSVEAARDNTGLLLLLLLFVFVTMVLLTVTLVRLGSLDRKVGALAWPVSARRPFQGGGNGVEFFYVH